MFAHHLRFRTDDGLRRDAEGWYYFVDRLKDALRRRGENISLFEVEQPVPADAEAGEDELMVVVVPAEGATISAVDIWAWCEPRLPAFAVPRYVRIAAELPMTPSGKTRKTELRAAGTAGAADREHP
jgi:carnitine-CoA ligase